jgi:hypothetical protein
MPCSACRAFGGVGVDALMTFDGGGLVGEVRCCFLSVCVHDVVVLCGELLCVSDCEVSYILSTAFRRLLILIVSKEESDTPLID